MLPDSTPSLLFRHYAEGAPVGLFGTGTDGRTTWVNRRWAELAGITVEQAMGEGWLTAVHPDDRAAVASGWQLAVSRQQPSAGDYRFLHADGRVVWVNGLARPDVDDQGTLRGYIGTITDITARVEAETLLAVQRDVLELVVSGAPLVDTMDLLLRTIEPGTEGPLCSILLLDDARRHVHTLSAPRLPREYSASIDGAEIGPMAGSCGTAAWLGMEVIVEDIETDPRWADYKHLALPHGLRACWSTPISDRDGSVLGTFAMYYRVPKGPTEVHRRVIASITDLAALAIIRDRELRALRQREQEFRGLFDQAGLGVAILKPTGEYVRVNQRFCEIAGVTPEGIIGQRMGILADPEQRSENEATFADLLAGRTSSHRGEHRLKREDGTTVWTTATASVVRSTQGAVDHVVIVIEDITTSRQLELQLRESQKIEAIGILAGGVAHDFNNLLSIVLGHAQMAHDDLPPDHPVREDLVAIAEASRHGAEITRQLLAFARREMGPPRPVDVNARILELHRMLARLLREEVELETSLAPDLWHVLLDPTQFDQALINLVSNARDAIAGAGTVRIETSNVTDGGEFVRITVRDTGCGMDAHTASQVFEPFFTTKPRGLGTGLGLSVVVGVVDGAGGRVSLESQPGKGAAFTMLLPRTTQSLDESARTTRLRREKVPQSTTILLVEDEAALLRLTARTLEREGYTVLAAAGPAAALDLLAAHQGSVDLLLSDVVMPGMSGPQLAVLMREERPGIRVLFMSGYPADVVTARATLPSFTDYLQKPFTADELLQRVEAVMQADT
jgi:PAS domain S-box-containing protein